MSFEDFSEMRVKDMYRLYVDTWEEANEDNLTELRNQVFKMEVVKRALKNLFSD